MSALVLSEDSSGDAFDAVRFMLRQILLAVDPQTQTHRIEFEPPDDPEVRFAIRANRWREGRGQEYTALLRAVASKLAEPNGFVFFHFDGDTPWAARAACLTRKQFNDLIASKIPDVIRMRMEATNQRARSTKKPERGSTEVEAIAAEAQRRLFALVPHYSIEAWCYQNTGVAREVCDREHGGRHRAQFAEWEANREALDEVVKPKEECCLGAGHNRELASVRYPWREAVAVEKSLRAAVEECSREPLAAALATTYAAPRDG